VPLRGWSPNTLEIMLINLHRALFRLCVMRRAIAIRG